MAVKKGKAVVVDKGKSAASASASSSSAKRKKVLASKDGGASSSKKRRSGVLKFVDDAAVEEGDDDSDFSFSFSEDEEDDDDSGDERGQVNRSKGFTNVKGNYASTSARTRNVPFFLKVEDLSGDELEDVVRTRYGHASRLVQEDSKQFDDGYPFMPPNQEPPVWRVKCMVGRERQIAFCFIQKFVELSSIGTKLPVISVFSVDNIKGYVFIEAMKESDVFEACKGFCNLYSSRISQAAKSEIPQLLSAKTSYIGLAKGTWVRITNGNYKGDLAQVVVHENGSQRAIVKLVPRINFQALAKKFGGGESLSQVKIPPRRLISPLDLEKFRPHIQIKLNRLTGEKFEVLDGLMIKDGYLYKKVSVASLSRLVVPPSRAELEKFESIKDHDDESNWVSVIFDGKKKVELDETDDVLGDETANGYKLNDLILFGQKSFGVIIGMKCDSFQVLQGGTGKEAAQVVTVQRKDIKSSCSDKMFAASDCNKNTITINDKVKAVDGPFKDKQGIVRHMYKGSLFVYDDKQTENCGFFCIRAQSCENLKELKSLQNENMVNRSNCTNVMESSEFSEDNCSKRFNRFDRDSRFLVGQTVRIRLGPLKGYLCRVVSVHRSTVTVKLDSLGKIITVNFDHISEVGLKNNAGINNSTIFDHGALDAPSDSGWGPLSTKLSMDSDFPANSCGWNTISTSILDQNQANNKPDGEADPWVSTLRPHGDQADLGSWGKEPDTQKGDPSAWHSANHVAPENQDESSCWEKNSAFWNEGTCTGTKGNDVWEKAKPQNAAIWGGKTSKSDDQPDSWGIEGKAPMKDGASVWGKRSSSEVKKDHEDAGGKAVGLSSFALQTCDSETELATSNEDVWSKAAISQNKKVAGDTNGDWGGQPKLSAGTGDMWANWNVSTNLDSQKDLPPDNSLNEARNFSCVKGSPEHNDTKNLNDHSSNWNAVSQSGGDKEAGWGKEGADGDKNIMQNSSAFGTWNVKPKTTFNSKSGNESSDNWNAKGNSTERNEAWGKQGFEVMTESGDFQKQNKGTGTFGWNNVENESDAWAKNTKGNDNSGKWNDDPGSSNCRNGSGTWNTKTKSADAINADEWKTTSRSVEAGGSNTVNNASKSSSWENLDKAVDRNDTAPWGKAVSKDKNICDDSGSCQVSKGSSWDNTITCIDKGLENTKDVWSQATTANQMHTNQWNKQTNSDNDQSRNWEKANDKSLLGPYKSSSGSSANASDKWSQPASSQGFPRNSWEKPQDTVKGGSDNWNNNASESAAFNPSGWEKTGNNRRDTDNWSVPTSSDTHSRNHGTWVANSDNTSFDRRQAFGGGRGDCSSGRNRGRGHDQRENLNNWNSQGREEQENKGSWSQRGRFGDGGRRGRGRNWDSGRGRGRGQGRGRFQSSDWSNRQNSQADWNSSGNSDSCWNKEKSFCGIEDAGRNTRAEWNTDRTDRSWNCTSSSNNRGIWTEGSSDRQNSSKPIENQSSWGANEGKSGWSQRHDSDRSDSLNDSKIAGDNWNRASDSKVAGDNWNRASDYADGKSTGRNEPAGFGPGAGNQPWNSNDKFSSWKSESTNDGQRLQSPSSPSGKCTTNNENQLKNAWEGWGPAAAKQLAGGTSCWDSGSKDGSGGTSCWGRSSKDESGWGAS